LGFLIKGRSLSVVKVKSNHKTKFEHWSDEGVDFPKIEKDDKLIVKYKNAEIIKGVFR